MAIPYIETSADLRTAVLEYARLMGDAGGAPSPVSEDVIRILPRQNVWVAVPDDEGGYAIAPSKFAGHKGLDLALYRKHLWEPEGSPERLNGTEAERRISNMGGSEIEIAGSSHPAAEAVRDFCNRFGKSVKSTARVRIFDQSELDDLDQADAPPSPAHASGADDPASTRGLTIDEAKRGLAIQFGCRPSDIRITIKA